MGEARGIRSVGFVVRTRSSREKHFQGGPLAERAVAPQTLVRTRNSLRSFGRIAPLAERADRPEALLRGELRRVAHQWVERVAVERLQEQHEVRLLLRGEVQF